MANLYRDTVDHALPTPPLDGDRHADVVVVGAGFTGLSTALHLAEKGAQVVVLEAEEVGWGASGRNGGQVNPGLKHDPDVVERDFGNDLGARMNSLAGAAPAFVFDLIERHGIACDARRNGTLRAAIRPREVASVRASMQQLRRRDAAVEWLEGSELERVTGTDRYRGALWDRRGGDLHPLRFARGLARAAQIAGASVYTGTRVASLTRHGHAWHVGTNSGTVVGAQVVLATNGYTDDLWPSLRRSVVPLFGAIAATASLPEAVAQVVMPSRAVLYESGPVTVYYRVDASQRLLIGGRGPQRELDSAAPLAHLRSYACRLWPALEEVSWTHAWGGRLAMTEDQYPHIHELAPGIIACLGYNGRGVAMATSMGAQLARRLLDPKAAFDMPITSLKTLRLHAFWPLAVRAVIARGRLAEFLRL